MGLQCDSDSTHTSQEARCVGHPAPAGDVGMFTAAAAALNIAATHLGTLGQAALSAAKNPYVLLGSVDAALAYGVGKEAVAAYRGECH